LSNPVSTSTFGIINSWWAFKYDIIFIGIVQYRLKEKPSTAGASGEMIKSEDISQEMNPDFLPHPWEYNQMPEGLSLKVLKAYTYNYRIKENDTVDFINCRKMTSSSSVNKLFTKIKHDINSLTRDKEIYTYYASTRKNWEHEIKNKREEIENKFRDSLTNNKRVAFAHTSLPLIRNWTKRNKTALVLGIIGYILSPFSPYNDAIVNYPISGLLTRLTIPVVKVPSQLIFLLFYLLTNVAGLFLMYIAFIRITSSEKLKMNPTRKQYWLLMINLTLLLLFYYFLPTILTTVPLPIWIQKVLLFLFPQP
jgi:hypothetical protein